jgi:hypothetical protein
MDEFDMRDLFAGLALVGMIVRTSDEQWRDRFIVESAYELADAMLEARKPQEEIGIAAITRKKPK